MQITFCGASGIVTGSCYLVETEKTKFLVDCWMFQWDKEITKLNYESFPFNPKEIDYIFLTHAHIDHSWLIPKIAKEWFNWKIIATSATIDLCEILFEDSANIQEQNIYEENKRRNRMWLEAREPLYSTEDAKNCMKLFDTEIQYQELRKITDEISIRYQDAGHIIGSASIEVFVKEWNKSTKIVFSGDIWQWNVPIIKDPTLIQEADYVFVESTYWDRVHEPVSWRDEKLLEEVIYAQKKWWKIFIPSFAVERTQEFLYSINKLIKQWKFPEQPVFLDSPLAIKATEIFKNHKSEFDEEALTKYKNPFSFRQLIKTPSVKESMMINKSKWSALVIAWNWMCTAWRIRHHLKHWLRDPKNTILFIWYQAEWTLWRHILEWEKIVRMMWLEIAVKAKVSKINSFSAHADSEELEKWMSWFTKKPKKVFIVHWERKSSEVFSKKLEELWFNCHIPVMREKVSI